MQWMNRWRPSGRLTVALAGLLSLACGWIASANPAESVAPMVRDRIFESGTMVLDPETAEVLLALGVLESSEADGSVSVVCHFGSVGEEITVLVIGVAGDVSAEGPPSVAEDDRLWKPSVGLPGWIREVGPCKDGVKTVRFHRSVRVVTACPNGGVTYAWVVEEVVWTLNCSTAVPAAPGPIAPDGNTPYQEGEAWPRSMPRTLPSDEGGSHKELVPTSVSPCT